MPTRGTVYREVETRLDYSREIEPFFNELKIVNNTGWALLN
jgi:hypothetical protein